MSDRSFNNGVINTGRMGNVQNGAPPSPFTAAGRAHGKSASDLRKEGLDGLGHPLPSQPSGRPSGGASRPSGPGGARGKNIAQLAQSIGDMELANQDDLHAFCEATRAVLNYFAVSIKLAEGQLKAAARAQARQAKDGWMTPSQRFKLGNTLRQVGRDLDHMANSCVAGAADAVKAWRRVEALLDEFESERKVRRPGGRSGGFTVV